ncbi:MAG TPA: aminoglycoside phosphotransferase family protein [Anaerolineales bacterium]|nr:aminoglycoside phosphotransferase family protein [Anaerolineales bacterium]
METSETALTHGQVALLCQRGFGSGFQIESIQELGGGTLNTAYLITSADHQKIVLRVAPWQTADTYWEETLLMRREHAMQPYFAPIAALMPRTLLIDFTHQLIERDYMFQSYIEGERWDNIVEELADEENFRLWEQFGNILKQIHSVRGEAFGLPLPGLLFPTWSQFVIERLERTLRTARKNRLDIPHLSSLLEFIRAHPQPLDEIHIPRLLHGDLWLFNILISRGEKGASIVGILDADRAWWGDPMADWTVFILTHTAREKGHSRFWQAYRLPDDPSDSKYRAYVYDAMHAATAFIWASRHNDEETVTKAGGTLSEAAEALPGLL